MEIRVTSKDDDGNIKFDGVLNQKEVEFVLNVGVNFLLANGVQPFLADDAQVQMNFPDSSNTVQ